ncbi:MAG: PadR family transcriptional regulator [Xanthobacteraceae bacterium]|jgi:PadR family transcriptional regulator, regulatory protein AphA
MSLRFALLGLLAVEPASGYDLKRAINRSTYFIWNATGPQIYNTLHKLREEGCITSKSLPQEGKPDKQIHTITAGGQARLEEFMNEPIRASVTRDEVLLRIFFGNFAGKKIIKRELTSYLERIRQERAFLEATEARINAHPGRKHEARRFQLLSLRIKVAQFRAMEQELERFLATGADKPETAKRRIATKGHRPRRANGETRHDGPRSRP